MTAPPADNPPAYPPAYFRETRRDVLIDFIGRTVFGYLITTGPDGPLTCGAPFVIRDEGANLVLEGHLSRANPQSMSTCARAVVLFAGPQAYVRPAWYPTKSRDGRAVPTWNHISVEVRGRLEVMGDPEFLPHHLDALSSQQEAVFADPWTPADPPAGYVDGLMRGIVGVRLTVTSLQGVWKLHQNHPAENRLGVMAGLGALKDDGARAIARAMEAREAQA